MMTVPKILVVTDIGNDMDDMMALLILGHLHKAGKIQIKAVIVTLEPLIGRAKLAKGLFEKCMGIDVEVACGTKGTDAKRETKEWDTAALKATFSLEKETFPNHLELSKRVLQEADRNNEKIRVLAIASLRDVWSIVAQDKDLFSKVISQVHVQGGSEVDGKKILTPRKDASNNTDDMEAAGLFYRFIQDRKIPSTIYNKEAAFVSGFSKDVFDPRRASKQMKGVAQYLYQIHDIQKKFFYNNSIKPKADRHREYMDRKWFVNANTKNLPAKLEDGPCSAEEILPYTIVTPYDPIAALGCVQDVTGFPLSSVQVPGIEPHIASVGGNLTKADGQALASKIRESLQQALRVS